ncbi:MAG: hypothetical protein WC285_02675 [Candidatus Gracilibacteria bacterium]|jgi:hypothetical protein
MENLSYKLLTQHQATQKKVYGFLCVLLIVVVGTYSYFQWQKYVTVKNGILADELTIKELTKTVADEKNAYNVNQKNFDALNKVIDSSVRQILPRGDEYTNLTRQMDAIEDELSKSGTFEISSIDYGTPTIDEQIGFGTLPVRMNIRGSQDNFMKFLLKMESSGSFADKLRLMSISSIRLNFESGDEFTDSKMITFSLQVNAYFQK